MKLKHAGGRPVQSTLAFSSANCLFGKDEKTSKTTQEKTDRLMDKAAITMTCTMFYVYFICPFFLALMVILSRQHSLLIYQCLF